MKAEQEQSQVSAEEIVSHDGGVSDSSFNNAGGGALIRSSGAAEKYGGRCGGAFLFMANPPAPFVQKVYYMVDDQSTNHIISWDPTGTSFIVWDPLAFVSEIMPNHFKHNIFSSFVCQLNTYGFKKVNWDRYEFRNEWFQRGGAHLASVKRKTGQKPQTQDTAARNYMAAEHTYLSEVDHEIRNLRTEHNLLNEEIMVLKKQVEESEKELEAIKKQSESSNRAQRRLVEAAKQALMLKERRETGGDQKVSYNENCRQLERMLMDELNHYKNVAEEEKTTNHQKVAIDLDDLIEGQADWGEYIKLLQDKPGCSLSKP